SWIVQDVMIFILKMASHHRRNKWLDFADDNPFHAWMDDKCASRDTSPATHDQHRTRPAMQQCGNVPEHSLQTHIFRKRGCLDLAADMEVSCCVRALGNGHGRIHALAHIDDVRLTAPCWQLPAPGD